MRKFHLAFAAIFAAAGGCPAIADEVINDELTVKFATCSGSGCLVDEDYRTIAGTTDTGSAELRLKANAIRVHYDDTSSSTFPANDWMVSINSEFQGGASFYRIEDLTAGSRPFVIEAGATSNALVINDNGDIGLGTSAPSTELHIVAGDTPAIRLGQNTTAGMNFYEWDIAGNESNFIIRDVATDSTPFRIRPNAPSDSIYIAANGEVGMGIPNPQGALHIRRNQPNNVPHLVLQNRRANGRAEIWFEDENTPNDNDALRLQLNDDAFNISFNGTGNAELQVNKTGDVRVLRGDLVVPNGGVIVGGQTLNVPDYVFAPEYNLMPLEDVEAFIAANSHLPHIRSAGEVAAHGLDLPTAHLALLKSHEELMLHTIALNKRVSDLEAALAADNAR